MKKILRKRYRFVLPLIIFILAGSLLHYYKPQENQIQRSNFQVIYAGSFDNPITQIAENESIYEENHPEQIDELEIFLPIYIVENANPFAPNVFERNGLEIFTPDYTENEIMDTPQRNVRTVRSLGIFELTAYCLCIICTEHYSYQHPRNQSNPNFVQRTASGTAPRAGRTVAVDPTIIPLGSLLLINGQEYLAEDRGGAIRGNIIDIFMTDHQSALNFGRRTSEVFLILE